MRFFSAWSNFTSSALSNVQAAVSSGDAQPSDIVWRGPDGSIVIAADSAELSEDYADFVDDGLVGEWLYDD